MHVPTSRSRFFLLAICLAALGLASPRSVSAQAAVYTQHNDNARTGANTLEESLSPTTVTAANFGKLFTISGLGANVNGQVLYVPYLMISGGGHNVVFAYTSNNSNGSPSGLAAYDADNGQQLWKTALPAAAEYTTPSPVIDPATGTLYALTKSTNDAGPTYLRAFDITTGTQKGATQIAAEALGTGAGTFTESQGPYAGQSVVAFDGNHGNGTFHANDRAALLLLNGVVYCSFAFNTDAPPYHGWILGYAFDGSSFTQKYAFCTTPNGSDGGIWMSGKGLTADSAGNIYCSVGNGTFDANTKGITTGTDYGMCYLKLSPSLAVEDWYAPYDEASQSNADLDLGNTGLLGIPGTNRLFAGATKFGAGFLLDSTNMGHLPPNAAGETVLQRLNGIASNGNVGQNAVAWNAGAYKYMYDWPRNVGVEQFRYDPSVGNFNPPSPTTNTSAYPANVFKQASATAGGSLAISSSGTNGAILWAVGYDGVVHAYNAGDVSQPELWNSSLNSSRDALGSVGHFQFPTVANGKVYVPDGSGDIVVYGLLNQPVLRFYNPNGSYIHLYTTSSNEANLASQAGYNYEGIIGYAPAQAASNVTPVYRMYSPGASDLFYTSIQSELPAATSAGYQNEGAWFQVLTATGSGTLPLYRFYWPSAGKHFYTTNQAEADYVTSAGFSYEGIVGYLYATP